MDLGGVVLYFGLLQISGRGVFTRYDLALPDLIFLGRSGDVFLRIRPADPTADYRGWSGYLGGRVFHLWHRTRFRSFWSGFRLFMAYSVLVSLFVLPTPPVREPGAIWVILTFQTGAQHRLTFGANLSLFRRLFLAPTPLAGDMAIAFIDDLFPSHTVRPPFFSFPWRPLAAS